MSVLNTTTLDTCTIAVGRKCVQIKLCNICYSSANFYAHHSTDTF